MSVRKTESRIPANLQASDLGQASAAADGRCTLVSFTTNPLVMGRENVYVVFVTDVGLATSAQSFEWTFTENDDAPNTQTTDHGEISYRPQSIGNLSIAVRILDSGNAEQANIALTQEVVPLNVELEELITNARNETGPTVANTDVTRELINDHNPYYQSVALQTPEADDAFQRFVFSMVYDGALQRTAARRKQQLSQLAASLNSQAADFATLAAEGSGVCGIRLTMLAMIQPQAPGDSAMLLNWTELPQPAAQRAVAEEQLRQNLAALNENTRIDLFNLVRFPKSNITECARIIETLRNHYFNGTNFNDVLTGMSGTRAHWIVRHYREGPLLRS